MTKFSINLVMTKFGHNLVMTKFGYNLVMTHFWLIFDPLFSSVTQNDKSGALRAAPEVGLDASPGAGTTANRLSSSSWVDFHYSFVRVGHLDMTKK